jgi:hypothetical protein
MTTDESVLDSGSAITLAMQNLPRLFILGAGFSVPAGLPTARELLDEVMTELHRHTLDGSKLEESLDEFRAYTRALNGGVDVELDIEQFSEFLSIDHYLRLRGSDTWSNSGNEDQLMLRWCIGAVLHKRTPSIEKTPPLYFDFAQRLKPKDVVVTFNYDRILENVLDHLNIPYRLVPNYISESRPGQDVIDSDRGSDEIILLKVHGSVDWIDSTPFLDGMEYLREHGFEDTSSFEHRNRILGPSSSFHLHDLVIDLRPNSDHLSRIRVCEDLDALYSSFNWNDGAPLLLIPALSKLLYADPVISFWQFINPGEWNFGYNAITVIGYSLPPADRYTQQVMYKLSSTYARSRTDEELIRAWRLPARPNILIVDYRTTESLRLELQNNYRFMNPDHATFMFEGFTPDSLTMIFGEASSSGQSNDSRPTGPI